MGYPRLIYLFEQIIFQARDQIARDFNELCYSQSNLNLPIKFAAKLSEIAQEKILEKTKKFASRQGIIVNNNIIKPVDNNDYLVLNFIPEQNNLLRSIPFITISIFSSKLDDNLIPQNITAAAILNPLTNQFYWSDTDNKARENFRKIMSSKVADINIANNFILNSANLELCWIASGKIDHAMIKFNHYLDIAAGVYIAAKAGAISSINHKDKYVKIAANQELFSCLK